MTTLESSAASAADKTVRIPSNVMALLRQSYDTREKMLDWLLAIAVVALLVWAFSDQLGSVFAPSDVDADTGRPDQPQPSQDVGSAFPTNTQRFDLYSYNLPPARNYKYGIGPSGTRPPYSPGAAPTYTE